MMYTVFILGLLTFSSGCTGVKWDAFQVTYGQGEGTGYFDMPWTVKEATAQEKWIKIDEIKRWKVDIYSQPEDPRVMLLFDEKGNIARIRLALLKEDIQNKAKESGYTFDLDYDKNLAFEKGNYFGQDLWYGTVLFRAPYDLESGGRSPLNKTTDNVAERIIFRAEGASGLPQWTEVNPSECYTRYDIYGIYARYVEGNCFPGIGKSYFYKLVDEENCQLRQPFWILFDEQKLIGFGFGGFGSFTRHPKTQNYFEDLQSDGTRNLTRSSLNCMEKNIAKYGLTSINVFLKKNVSMLTCPPSDFQPCKHKNNRVTTTN